MIRSLTLENFLPFRARVTLPMDDQGLVLVRGKNTVSAALDSNGVGKTSIAHGVSWCLFGEDLAGRKADAVACRFTEGTCEASMVLEDELGPWSVTRTRRPARLAVDGVPGVLENEDMAEVQKKLEARLGFGLRTFRNAVVFGQGSFDRYANADQAEQLRMLDEIQGVDFRGDLKRAQEWRDQLRGRRADEQRAADDAAGRLEEVSASLAAMRRARDGFDADQAARVKELEAQVAAAVKELADLDAADAALAERTAELATLREALEARNAAARAYGPRHDAAAAELEKHGASYRRLEQESARFLALVEQDACPMCRQAVKSRKKAVAKLFEETLVALRADEELAKQTVETFAEESRRYAAALFEADERLKKLAGANSPEHRVAQLDLLCGERVAASHAARRAELEADAAAIRKEIAEARRRRWSGQDDLDASEANVAALTAVRASALQKVSRVDRALVVAEYWHEGFGDRGVRSLLVDGAAEYINERVAKHLEALAAGEATLRMSAQTALKKGGARERISFTPEWSWGGSGAGTGSGGQDRRVDLALFAAVQDLAETRSARPFPLKIWDEPGDALDGRGQELFLRWVQSDARRRGTGLLVTHSEQIAAAAEPDHVWTVVLDRDGAHVEVS